MVKILIQNNYQNQQSNRYKSNAYENNKTIIKTNKK